MHVDLALNFSRLYGFLLVLARVSGVIAFVPIPGVSAGPDASRIVLTLAITIALFPVWPAPAVQGPIVSNPSCWNRVALSAYSLLSQLQFYGEANASATSGSVTFPSARRSGRRLGTWRTAPRWSAT
jgi:hypothetical protein